MAARVFDYPDVERLVNQAPWLGHGGGTYLPDIPMYILDNQYLKTAVELGFFGVIALLAYFLVPLIAAISPGSAARTPNSDCCWPRWPALRWLLRPAR